MASFILDLDYLPVDSRLGIALALASGLSIILLQEDQGVVIGTRPPACRAIVWIVFNAVEAGFSALQLGLDLVAT